MAEVKNIFDDENEAIATAPGDIPLPMVRERIAAQANQFRHDNTIRPFAPQPDEPVEIWATSGVEMPLDRAEVWFTTDGRLPDQSSHKIPMVAKMVDWEAGAGYLSRWQAILPGQVGGTAVRYRIAGWQAGRPADAPPDLFAHDGQGFWYPVADETGIQTFAYFVEPDQPVGPDWMQEAVIYHIFLDRYHPGTVDGRFSPKIDQTDPHARHGGTLRGVTQTLPYLEKLGINCLWLSPLGLADTYHRYDTKDLFAIDPELGSEADLHELVEQAHARNIRVILDFVPSHCSWKHPAFLAAQEDPEADTASWFVFYEHPDNYRCFLGLAKLLPSFDTNDPAGRQHICDAAVYWLNKFKLDGFRLDHVIGHGMDFWVQFRQAVQAANPEAVTIGEATDSPDALRRYRGRMSHVLDFPLATAFRYAFALDLWDVTQLDAFLQSYEAYMASGADRASFLDNHDMNRFLFMAGGDVNRLKLAALCQFTLAPTPIIYYGTEVGLSQAVNKNQSGFGGDHHVRADMPWQPEDWDEELLSFYRRLVHLRRTLPALQRGKRTRLHVDAATQTYAYARELDGGETAVALFNLGYLFQIIPLPNAENYDCLISTGTMPVLEEDRVMIAAGTAVIIVNRE
ncbi:alpha-amylase family glycosyl hydrolase [Candidatus Leptofilum sp.]|uniref:alpha-amylase family glycosyl hydrolase n=1 Tax=Candidatus Leptofilum sp. TaxID=3241576 RepID=UPI003B5AD6C0